MRVPNWPIHAHNATSAHLIDVSADVETRKTVSTKLASVRSQGFRTSSGITRAKSPKCMGCTPFPPCDASTQEQQSMQLSLTWLLPQSLVTAVQVQHHSQKVAANRAARIGFIHLFLCSSMLDPVHSTVRLHTWLAAGCLADLQSRNY